ncbi:tetratricopeptide repeat protein [Fulvivirga ligni]|uniref:tetratricopeptide repeat protein n=1 Tax=Fulvivirga ligni TaxID=2904246 RepID=UPI001F24D92D|nr:hypothetical protein [Fulvivirga ligni]UII23933.1 hypothetical protein LVD16_11960 [Fulvivirga ligni]
MKKVSITTYLFLCLFTSFTFAQTSLTLNKSEIEAYHHILSLRFEATTSLLDTKRAASSYLQNMQESMILLFTEDQSLFTSYTEAFEDRYETIEDIKEESPYKLFYLAELKLQSAFVNLKLGNEWDAAWQFRKAYKLIEENTETYPDFLPNYKSLGMLHIILGSVPAKYQWILHLLGMEGTVEDGIDEINKLAKSDNIFQAEAEAIRCLLKSYLLNETQEAIQEFEQVYNKVNDNMLFGYLYMSLLMKNSDGEKALIVYNRLSNLNDGYFDLNLLSYTAGEIYLQKGDYIKAEAKFKLFIKKNKGRNLLKDAWYKLFLTYWLNGQTEKAQEAFSSAQNNGTTDAEADKHAAKNLAKNDYPNVQIMKLRLATDGGFYERAESILNSDIEITSDKDKCELDYRKARFYHKTNKLSKAKTYYKNTIDLAKNEHWYFAPNSCLQLGYIYLEEGLDQMAKSYFEKVLKYKDYEYETSLTNKANAALAELN